MEILVENSPEEYLTAGCVLFLNCACESHKVHTILCKPKTTAHICKVKSAAKCNEMRLSSKVAVLNAS